VQLLPNGIPVCCAPANALAFPFDPAFWVAADDIPGPEYASVGHWEDKAGGDDDANQKEDEQWPRKTFTAMDMQEAVRFGGDEWMLLDRALTAPAWTLWAVFHANRASESVIAGPSPGFLPRLAAASNLTTGTRFVTFSVGTLLESPTVPAFGPEFTRPVFAKVTYNGLALSLSCYNDLTGEAVKLHPDEEYTLAFLGLPGSDEDLPTDIGEVMWWPRALSDEENAGVLRYLEEKYPDGDAEMRAGMIVAFAGPLVPTGYLACDGTDYAEADRPELFGAIGHTWDTFRGQASPGAGRFRVPLLDGLGLVGTGGAGTSPTTSARALADVVGEEEHQLTTAELASHAHGVTDPGHTHTGTVGMTPTVPGTEEHPWKAAGGLSLTEPLNIDAETTGVTVDTEGSDTPHNNMQPSAAVAFIIKT